jgi:hypothetical protein
MEHSEIVDDTRFKRKMKGRDLVVCFDVIFFYVKVLDIKKSFNLMTDPFLKKEPSG